MATEPDILNYNCVSTAELGQRFDFQKCVAYDPSMDQIHLLELWMNIAIYLHCHPTWKRPIYAESGPDRGYIVEWRNDPIKSIVQCVLWSCIMMWGNAWFRGPNDNHATEKKAFELLCQLDAQQNPKLYGTAYPNEALPITAVTQEG